MIYLWDVSGLRSSQWRRQRRYVWDIAWSPDGTRLAASSDNRGIRIWDVMVSEERMTLHDLETVVTTIAWSPDRRLIQPAGGERMITIWNAENGAPLLTLDNLAGTVHLMSFGHRAVIRLPRPWPAKPRTRHRSTSGTSSAVSRAMP
ncbi:MAG: hypothetical protein R2867_36840 [Caldilineaceae bacterium]